MTFKCKYGSTCLNDNCLYSHPGSPTYLTDPYVLLSKRCLYENMLNSCKKKCGEPNGQYCPYTHCNHIYQLYRVIRCTQTDCQFHCPSCI
jgi:hypothetical protein